MKHSICDAAQAELVYWTNILLEEPAVTNNPYSQVNLAFPFVCSLFIFSIIQRLMDQQVWEDALHFC